jgi:hypothetical protein
MIEGIPYAFKYDADATTSVLTRIYGFKTDNILILDPYQNAMHRMDHRILDHRITICLMDHHISDHILFNHACLILLNVVHLCTFVPKRHGYANTGQCSAMLRNAYITIILQLLSTMTIECQ